ncbi:MAG: hypothetical protein QOC54_2651 [Baekduia sp.]|nr:hypothetical protein [Baekduia sp.]
MSTSRGTRVLAFAVALILISLVPGVAGAASKERDRPAKSHKAHGREKDKGEATVKQWAREHRRLKRRLPIAIVKEKLGKGEGGELRNGPNQAAVDQRAYPKTYVDDARAAAGRQAYLDAPSGGLTAAWNELGPFTPLVAKENTYTGAPTTNSGRTTAVVVDPNCGQPGTACRAWIAAAGGGIFRTDDILAAHVVWTPADTGLTTDAFGSLIIDPTDPSGNTLYAGSGEPNASSDSEAGQGLFRSTDGGQSWELVPGSVAVAQSRAIGSIAIDPDDGTLYLGTALARHGSSSSNGGRRTPPNAPTLGLYKSTDRGQSFSLVFSKGGSPANPATGTDLFQGGVNKVVVDPQRPAQTGQSRPVYVALFGYGIWRSAPSIEGGDASFKQVFQTLYPADPAGDRTEFDLTVRQNGKVRAYVGDGSEGDDPAVHPATSELWRSDDVDVKANTLVSGAGANLAPWKKLSSSDPSQPGFASYNFCQGQCTYDQFVVADPRNPDAVLIGGSMAYDDLQVFGGDQRTNGRAVMRSTDAGATFNDMTNDATVDDGADTSLLAGGVTGMHPDQHAVAFDPYNPNFFFVGSDGGVVRVNGKYVDHTGDCTARKLTGDPLKLCEQVLRAIPERIDSLNDGLRTLQFQSVSLNPAQPGSDLLGGTQDNGTWAFDTDSSVPNGFTTFESIGGDGGNSSIGVDQVKVHTYYGPTMDANFGADGGNNDSPRGWDYISEPLDSAAYGPSNPEAFSFYVPLAHDPKTPGTLFTGGEYVWRTTDNGGDRAQLDAHCRETTTAIGDSSRVCGDWVRIGRQLSAGGDLAAGAGDYIVAVERAPSDASTLWVGTRQGHLWVSHNADAASPAAVQFTPVTAGSLPGRFVSSIFPDPTDPSHAWVSYSGYSAYTPSTPGHVFDVRANPDTGAATASDLSDDLGDQPVTDLVRDDNTGDLYASTDFGVLQLPAGASTWRKAAAGLPLVAVYGLAIDPGAHLLYAATHGRGVYRVNLPGGTAPDTVAPTPGPNVAALAGASAGGASAGARPAVPAPVPVTGAGTTSRPAAPGVRLTRVHVTRSGSVVTVRFRVNRLTKVRVTVRDRHGKVVGRSPLRTVAPGHDQRVHVTVPRRAAGPVKATVASQPEAKAPAKPKSKAKAGG